MRLAFVIIAHNLLIRIILELHGANCAVGSTLDILFLLETLSEHDLTKFDFHGLGLLDLHILHDDVAVLD